MLCAVDGLHEAISVCLVVLFALSENAPSIKIFANQISIQEHAAVGEIFSHALGTFIS